MEPENLMMMEVIREAAVVINDLYGDSLKNKETRILEEALWRACNKIKKLQKELIN